MYEVIAVPRKINNLSLKAFSYEDEELFSIKSGRELVKRYKDYQIQAFKSGIEVETLLKAHAKSIDNALYKLFSHFALDKASGLCLVAVGGYGREEQFIGSDIDLLIAYDKDPLAEETQENIGKFISYLWDLKLDLGTSVRSIAETVLEARKDITIKTNLLEKHFICGDLNTYKNLCNALEHDDFWDAGKFLQGKIEEQKERYHHYRDTVYSIEPDVKNNPGGLRDLQLMQWIAIVKFKALTPKQMQEVGLITSSELDEYIACRDFLWNMRFALHCNCNGAHNNRLTLDIQKAVASALNYGDDGNLPVEQMMRALFRTFRRVRELNAIVLQQSELLIEGHIGENYQEPVFLDSNFVKRGDFIDIIDHELFKYDPPKLLSLFLIIASYNEIKDIHVNCLRALRESRRNFKHYLIENPECRKLFKKLLSLPKAVEHSLPLMHETRVLSAYMPQWERIEGLTQFDMFHLFSVDEHTIRVLNNFATLCESKDPIFALFKNIYKRLERPDLLTLVALLHDIGKGCGGHHADIGAFEAENFCQFHGYSTYETAMVSWTIKSHLLFSTTATRRDITDPEVVMSFARLCKDEEHLNMLYCLTVADICATNDREWSSWKETIFRQLYHSTRQALNQSDADITRQQAIMVHNTQRSVRKIARDCSHADLDRYLSQFPATYFIHYRPDEIAWHARNILRFNDLEKPLILFAQNPNIGTELLIFFRSNSPVFFGKIVYAMAMKRLNVLSAQIFLTHNGHILCTIKFQNQKGQQVDNDRLYSLRKTILDGLKNSTPLQDLPKVSCSLFNVPTKISYLKNHGSKQTSIEISTLDSPGLLAKIGITLGNCNCLISAARIATTGERADDFFAVTDINGLPLDEKQQELLSSALYKALEGNNTDAN